MAAAGVARRGRATGMSGCDRLGDTVGLLQRRHSVSRGLGREGLLRPQLELFEDIDKWCRHVLFRRKAQHQ